MKINGTEVKGKDRMQVSQLLRGSRGSALELLLLREGTRLHKELIRDEHRQRQVRQ